MSNDVCNAIFTIVLFLLLHVASDLLYAASSVRSQGMDEVTGLAFDIRQPRACVMHFVFQSLDIMLKLPYILLHFFHGRGHVKRSFLRGRRLLKQHVYVLALFPLLCEHHLVRC